jgi:hemerythrin superfamily protein
MRNPIAKLTNPIEMLTADHETVKTLFEQCESTEPGAARTLLADEIFKDLHLHATLEEEIFYPAARERLGEEAGNLVEESYREHSAIKELVAALERMDSRDPQFLDRLRHLRNMVVSHAEKEEERLFPLAEAGLPLRQLALEMDARRLQLMVRKPSPSVLAMAGAALIGVGVLAVLLTRGRSRRR